MQSISSETRRDQEGEQAPSLHSSESGSDASAELGTAEIGVESGQKSGAEFGVESGAEPDVESSAESGTELAMISPKMEEGAGPGAFAPGEGRDDTVRQWSGEEAGVRIAAGAGVGAEVVGGASSWSASDEAQALSYRRPPASWGKGKNRGGGPATNCDVGGVGSGGSGSGISGCVADVLGGGEGEVDEEEDLELRRRALFPPSFSSTNLVSLSPVEFCIFNERNFAVDALSTNYLKSMPFST